MEDHDLPSVLAGVEGYFYCHIKHKILMKQLRKINPTVPFGNELTIETKPYVVCCKYK